MATCAHCAQPFTPKRADARFCSGKCRQGALRARQAGTADPVTRLVTPVTEPDGDGGSTAGAVREQLQAVGRLDTYLGRSAIALAARIDSATAVMGFAAMVKQLEATMKSALAGTQTTTDAVDEIRAARDRKRAAG